MEERKRAKKVESKYEYQLNTGGKPTEIHTALIQTMATHNKRRTHVYTTSTLHTKYPRNPYRTSAAARVVKIPSRCPVCGHGERRAGGRAGQP